MGFPPIASPRLLVFLPYHRHRMSRVQSRTAAIQAMALASLRLRHLSPSASGAAAHRRLPAKNSSSFAQLRCPSSCLAGTRPLRSRLTRVYALSSNDIRVGSNLEVDGAPWKVLEFLHVKPGKGAAFVRTKMRNYITGNTVEKTFRAGSTIPEASISKETKQFTYKDGSQFVFMDLTTFEESRLNEGDVGDKQKWLKEGMDCNLLYWNGRVFPILFYIICCPNPIN
ncbi:hypothetical protein E2562_025192 [Oryza meyeriana var. granulata]|uniref:Translation elongation factor P/YeiP central domain-containing protein n=1 Tax=Oryza meyeriana var. granulata TaxID=110450 RepID=A0A6G1E1Q8_9ORYZ|nr:hypothetical protein E2562_025192 [Oryza meyeriana var. granulata]